MSIFLHSLIQQMTMREKAYFKRFTQLYKGKRVKNYEQLYEVLEAMPQFDEQQLKEHFADQSIGKYLSSELNYLLGQLLKSLINFHLGSTPERALQKAILFVDILIEKGYRKQALKRLNQAKKIAAKYEFFTTTLKLIQLEEEILFRQGILGFTQKLERLEQERQQVNAQISNFNQLRLVREQLRELWFSDGYIADTAAYPYFFDNKLLDDPNAVLSLRAQEHWLYIKALRWYIVQDHPKAQQAFAKGLVFLERYDYLFKETSFLVFISNHLYNSALSKDQVAFQEMIKKLEGLTQTQAVDHHYLKYIKYSRIFELHYQLEDFAGSRTILPEVSHYIQRYHAEMELTQSNYIYFLLVRACILNRDYEQALDFLNQWLQLNLIDYYIIYTRLFTLMIYLELGLSDLILSEVDASYKLLKRHRQYNRLAKAFLRFFKVYIRKPQQLPKTLQQLIDKLQQIDHDPAQRTSIKYFNFLTWAEDKQMRLQKAD